MHATATTDDGRFELRPPRTDAEWNAYHSLRERSFWVGLGLDKTVGDYDPAHPDQYQPDYSPLILIRNGIIVGTMGLQDMGGGVIQVRAVGVDPACQYRGYGSVMIAMAENWARTHGFDRAWLYSHESAVMFYARNAYTYGAAHGMDIPACPIPGGVALAKRLARGMRHPHADMMIAAA
ncbi:MAG: GNAT family N-acetyltransferase [Rhodospirillales bacterium]